VDTKDTKSKVVPVTKALNEELKQAMFVVMVPDEIDAHGDITSEEEIRKACYNYNKYSREANLFHVSKTESFFLAESFVAPVEFFIEDRFVKKGTWLATVQALDDDLWALIKSGDICSLSIGALARVQELE